jgi:hypothetical protein
MSKAARWTEKEEFIKSARIIFKRIGDNLRGAPRLPYQKRSLARMN